MALSPAGMLRALTAFLKRIDSQATRMTVRRGAAYGSLWLLAERGVAFAYGRRLA